MLARFDSPPKTAGANTTALRRSLEEETLHYLCPHKRAEKQPVSAADSNPAARASATQGVGVVRARQHERELVPAASSQRRERRGVAQVM